MRELTLLGFLTQYVRKLSYGNTNNIYKLADEVNRGHYRLREPLVLYAMCSGKEALLLRAAKHSALYEHGSKMFATYNKDNIELALQDDNRFLNSEYKKVWSSYQCAKNKLQSDNHTKELIRQKIKQIQQQKCISNYKIYTGLKLNKGNVNAWLKDGVQSKVSLNTARLILKYVHNLSAG